MQPALSPALAFWSRTLRVWLTAVLLAAGPAWAENYSLEGEQDSRFNFLVRQTVEPPPGIQELTLSFVAPASFDSPTYVQRIGKVDLAFEPAPWKQTEETDRRGNRVVAATWKHPSGPIRTALRFQAANRVRLRNLTTFAPFPLPPQPGIDGDYLSATVLVTAADPEIRRLAGELTRSSQTVFGAVQQILTWLVDHMRYAPFPDSLDAAYALRQGEGNCQNYSHLAAAMLRAVGIPVRIVNGYTLAEPYDIHVGKSVLTPKMALGRHAWIEVFFPDLGWVPFDPSGTEMFVSNRFIRVETGADNAETKKDGLISWKRAPGSAEKPDFKEVFEAEWLADEISLQARKEDYGPRKLLLCPPMESLFAKVTRAPAAPAVAPAPAPDLDRIEFSRPHAFGNLEFPRAVDFLAARGPARKTESGTMEMEKNFLVETAEYVTTQGRQYAQVFSLDRPMQLKSVALALRKFGGDGQMWLELFRDGAGKPGDRIAASDIYDLEQIKSGPGYDWIEFLFGRSAVRLSPGRYWIALGFTGGPVLNWFFTYGKPVGPQDGTRCKTIFDTDWSRSLAYEFNYRITGLAAK